MITALPARTALPQILLNNADITTTLTSHLIGFSYTDHTADKADDLQIELEDTAREWVGPSLPQKGASIDANIVCSDWRFPGDTLTLECGNFTIDNISFRGPPNTVSIKANSIPHKAKIKNTQKTRAWENTAFQSIAEQVAGENGLRVRWDTQLVPRYGRVEQIEESPLAFLKRKANDCGLSVKITKGEIVFFDEESYEAKQPTYTLRYGDNLVSWSFSTKLTDVFGSSTVSYQNPETGRLTTHTFKPEEAPVTDAELRSSDRLEAEEQIDSDWDPSGFAVPGSTTPTDWQPTDWKDDTTTSNKGRGKGIKKAAERKAKKQLREKNKEEQTAEFMVMGNPLLAAGMTVALSGFGQFDSNYIIATCTHSLRSGYTTKLSLRKCLKGY